MKKLTLRTLLRVEGKASLRLLWKDGRIEDARIILSSSRGIEKVLIGRPAMDALVIVPRVCGICGHAHLMACVKALESFVHGLEPSEKANLVREITQLSEIVQNHVKWFYLFVLPDMLAFRDLEEYRPFRGRRWLEAVRVSSKLPKVIATFGGQWPHSSYAVPGGITSTFTEADVFRALSLIGEAKEFFLRRTIGIGEEEYRSLRKKSDVHSLGGDLGLFLELCDLARMMEEGRAYNRFIVGGEIREFVEAGHFNGKRRIHKFNIANVREEEGGDYSLAKAVRYRGLPYETGPLARQHMASNPLVCSMLKTFKDSYPVRITARVLEIGDLLLLLEDKLRKLLEVIDQPSCTEAYRLVREASGEGWGVVEAARGTLIHRVFLEKGRIRSYEIVTPSQWNLGPRTKNFLGVAEKAIVGLDSEHKAGMVVRSFDMCSVCTTH